MDAFKHLRERIVMVGMIPVQLKEVARILENSEILIGTMNLHAEDFCQEGRGSPDIFDQKVNPKTRQVTAKFRGRRLAGNAFIQTLLPDSSKPLSTNAKAGSNSRLFCPTNELNVKQSNVSY